MIARPVRSRTAQAASRPDFAAAATAVQRLSVLLAAGIGPAAAWRYLAEDDPERAAALADVASADDVLAALPALVAARPAAERSGWAAVAAVWRVATTAGAALAGSLERLATGLRDLDQAARAAEVAIAGPRATSRVVLVLPAVGLSLGLLLGFDVIGALVSPPGLVCLALGVGLLIGGMRWTARLVAHARRTDATAGLGLDLLAIALSGGVGHARARDLVRLAAEDAGLDLDPGDGEAVLAFAARAGIPAVALLRAEADDRRRNARDEAARAAAELETRLLLPLGVCVLPAFVALGVAPIAIAIISSTVTGIG